MNFQDRNDCTLSYTRSNRDHESYRTDRTLLVSRRLLSRDLGFRLAPRSEPRHGLSPPWGPVTGSRVSESVSIVSEGPGPPIPRHQNLCTGKTLPFLRPEIDKESPVLSPFRSRLGGDFRILVPAGIVPKPEIPIGLRTLQGESTVYDSEGWGGAVHPRVHPTMDLGGRVRQPQEYLSTVDRQREE